MVIVGLTWYLQTRFCTACVLLIPGPCAAFLFGLAIPKRADPTQQRESRRDAACRVLKFCSVAAALVAAAAVATTVVDVAVMFTPGDGAVLALLAAWWALARRAWRCAGTSFATAAAGALSALVFHLAFSPETVAFSLAPALLLLAVNAAAAAVGVALSAGRLLVCAAVLAGGLFAEGLTTGIALILLESHSRGAPTAPLFFATAVAFLIPSLTAGVMAWKAVGACRSVWAWLSAAAVSLALWIPLIFRWGSTLAERAVGERLAVLGVVVAACGFPLGLSLLGRTTSVRTAGFWAVCASLATMALAAVGLSRVHGAQWLLDEVQNGALHQELIMFSFYSAIALSALHVGYLILPMGAHRALRMLVCGVGVAAVALAVLGGALDARYRLQLLPLGMTMLLVTILAAATFAAFQQDRAPGAHT